MYKRQVDVYIQGTGYVASTANLRTAVQDFLNNGVVNGVSVSPWFAQFAVQTETRTAYTIDGTITYQNPATEASIAAAITAQELTERRLGRTVDASRFVGAALGVLGVISATLTLTPTPPAGSNDTVYVGSIGTITYTAGTII